jgi:Domain of unknown function (DUF4124)
VKGLLMKLLRFLWVLILISGMGSDLEAGEIYQWIDKDGVQHFTNVPPPPGAQIVEGLSEASADEPPATTGPKKPKGTGAVESDENRPTDREDTGAVESSEDGPTGREDYWRRLGWGNDTKDREDTGAAEGGEDRPANRDDPGAVEGGENVPTDRKPD